MTNSAEDTELREASIAWLQERTQGGELLISKRELMNDFHFQGQRRPMKNGQRGIHSSRGFRVAWTITTAYAQDESKRPYDDAPGPDGLPRYKWEKSDPNNSGNRALRKAMELSAPLIWFLGVGDGLYKAVFPVYLVAEERSRQQFVISVEDSYGLDRAEVDPGEIARSYREYLVRTRIHQPVFRERVLRAYEMQCAICGMPRSELLDAAHIVPDKERDGIASVPNGMSLCKIHHSAYDCNMLGVTPDYEVVLRQDILEGSDGPVYEFGLKAAHGKTLLKFPRRASLRPDKALLAQRFDEFTSSFVSAQRPPDVIFPGSDSSGRAW